MRRERQTTALRTFLALACGLPLGACASAGSPPPRVDLSPAREEIEAARRVGAERTAPEPFGRAQKHLAEAESLAAAKGKGSAERARQAESLARLSATEAEWAAAVAGASRPAAAPRETRSDDATPARPDLEARLQRAEEEQHRLEERAALLMKELELTETEVVRTKAKVRGQTMAEASSAIAEARILLRRMADAKVRSSNLARSQELVDRAEQLLREDNMAGAVFFAMTAQDLVEQTRRLAADPGGIERPVSKTVYIAPRVLNVRKGPALTEPVVGQVAKGTPLEARSRRGEWLLVNDGRIDGWVFGPLLR